MLIDDQRDWLRINCKALDEAGFQCEPFLDRTEAVKAFKDRPARYVLVVVDVNLGGKPDGVAIAREILNIKPNTNLALISTDAQLRGHEKDLEEIAQTTGLKYFRKKGDEEGGKQIVNIARQYFVSMPAASPAPKSSLSAGALQTWEEANEQSAD